MNPGRSDSQAPGLCLFLLSSVLGALFQCKVPTLGGIREGREEQGQVDNVSSSSLCPQWPAQCLAQSGQPSINVCEMQAEEQPLPRTSRVLWASSAQHRDAWSTHQSPCQTGVI